MVVLQHEHTLILIDLNPKYPHDGYVYDDEEDLIIQQAFQNPCNLCCQQISFLHKYYYKCDRCDYSVHKLCAELPTNWKHASHSAHTLTLFLDESQERCHLCKTKSHYKQQLCYNCSKCMFYICLECATGVVQYHTIYHPSHQHPLIPIHRERQISAMCDACGEKQDGVFYHCAICFRSFIHNDCVFQLRRLLIQDGTCGRFFHSHPLILTYSFSKADQDAKFYPSCRICDNSFSNSENLWLYKCDKCRYYVHLHCAILSSKPINSDTPSQNYTNDPKVFHLPLTDETYYKIKDFIFKESKETTVTHFGHEHPLTLVDNDVTTPTSSTITTTLSFRDLVDDKVKDRCGVCKNPIVDTFPFYKCAYKCKFFLHEWCTRLPSELKGCLREQKHTLLLSKARLSYILHFWDNFRCYACNNYDKSTQFSYNCVECACSIHVPCALIPKEFTHISHPFHLLSLLKRRPDKDYCRICLSRFMSENEISLSCKGCNFHLHPACALLFPETIKHKYDKHPMALCYGPIGNYEGDYFCEVCEEEFNPNASFYHCQKCAQSVHLGCAPMTPQSKVYMYHFFRKLFMNYTILHKN